jgi:uncharacterized protein YunC (DUF1805 family)
LKRGVFIDVVFVSGMVSGMASKESERVPNEVLIQQLEIDGRAFLGVRIELGAPLLLIKGEKGYLGCGYFSLDAANNVGDALAIVRGVFSFDDMLDAEVKEVSQKAK